MAAKISTWTEVAVRFGLLKNVSIGTHSPQQTTTTMTVVVTPFSFKDVPNEMSLVALRWMDLARDV